MSTVKTLAWIGLVGWMAGGTYWHVCKIKELCDGGPALTAAASSVPGLNISDGTALSLASLGNFAFKKSLPGVSLNGVQSEFDSLAGYLKSTGKLITVTGGYASDEANNTSFPNLGLARAEDLKAKLVAAGVPAASVLTAAEMKDIAFNPADSAYGLGFAFSGMETPKGDTEAALAEAEKYEGVFKPMDLYFPSGSSSYIKTSENQKFMDEAAKYLAANADKKLALTGHTDSDGSDDSNLALSKRRAEATMKALAKEGIKAEQLVADGKGEAQPIAANDTPAGKKANRRVSIVVQ